MAEIPRAKVIKATKRHICLEEISDVDSADLYLGSIAECSCGKQFIKTELQRDGICWADYDPSHTTTA